MSSWGLRHRTIYSHGVLLDFLGIPSFQLCFEMNCSRFWGLRHLFLWCFGGFSANPAISAICCWTRNPFWGLRQCIKVTCSPFWGYAIYSCLFGVWLGLHVLHNVLVDFLGIRPFQSAIYSCIFRFGLVCKGNGTFIPAVF